MSLPEWLWFPTRQQTHIFFQRQWHLFPLWTNIVVSQFRSLPKSCQKTTSITVFSSLLLWFHRKTDVSGEKNTNNVFPRIIARETFWFIWEANMRPSPSRFNWIQRCLFHLTSYLKQLPALPSCTAIFLSALTPIPWLHLWTHTHTRVHTHTNTFIHKYTQRHKDTYTYTNTHLCTYTHSQGILNDIDRKQRILRCHKGAAVPNIWLKNDHLNSIDWCKKWREKKRNQAVKVATSLSLTSIKGLFVPVFVTSETASMWTHSRGKKWEGLR